MKLSYLVTCSTETKTLQNLLEILRKHILSENNEDELIIIIDSDAKDNQKTRQILTEFSQSFFNTTRVKVLEHPLANDYGSHKNWGNSKCTGQWIFQIDGDELPKEELLLNIKDIIEANSDTELFFVPRINDYIGVTPDHAKQWGWILTPCDSITHEKIINTDSVEYKFLKEKGYILEESPI
jgi:hypothetical protein